MRTKKKSVRNCFIVVLAIMIIGAGIYVIKNKILTPAMFQALKYEVQGVDVSHYQGDIDWEVLQSEGIDFAFIKATEGSEHVDDKFSYNMEEAYKTGLCVGAYHFFSFDSPGEGQAQHYIRTVGDLEDKLPPIIDFEFYGDIEKEKLNPEEVRKELESLLSVLEKEYGATPIIYATPSTYKTYIEGHFWEYPIWIRNMYYETSLERGRQWTFWQYKDNARLEGYSGEQDKIDLNVFRGSKEELDGMKVKGKYL